MAVNIRKIKLRNKYRLRLFKLSQLLDQVPEEKFNISSFLKSKDSYSYAGDETPNDVAVYQTCGTTACALGWAPALGGKFAALEKESWSHYGVRVFNIGEIENDNNGDLDALWDWCFSGEWESADNTAKGAAARIRFFLYNRGIATYDYYDDVFFDAASYKNFLPKTYTFAKPIDDKVEV